MNTTAQAIRIEPQSELGRTLKAAQATGNPVIVDTGEERFTILVALTEPPRDVFADYDPQAAVAGLRALEEVFVGVDREQLLRDVHAQRAQDSSGRPD